MKILIDTNRYSDFAKGEEKTVDLFTTAEQIFVPFVVIAELRAGFQCGTISRQNEATLVRFLGNDRVSVLYADAQTTQAYAEIYSMLRRNGTPIPTNDIWIAALAVQHSLPLCSRDAHFALIPQLARI
jgi:tRNA(fMet)-specific endonuclease VapC